MNVLVISGFIGTMEELKAVGDTNVLKFTIATSRSYKNKAGERETDWHTCEVWGKTAEIIAQYFAKGKGIEVVGELQYDKWQDKEGNNRTSAKVRVNSFGFPPVAKSEQAQPQEQVPAKAQAPQAQKVTSPLDADDLPF